MPRFYRLRRYLSRLPAVFVLAITGLAGVWVATLGRLVYVVGSGQLRTPGADVELTLALWVICSIALPLFAGAGWLLNRE